LDERLAVKYSDFQRTTDPHHKKTAQALWLRTAAKGDIYLSAYEGWCDWKKSVGA
jgi:methionyl-tRNA synthetase